MPKHDDALVTPATLRRGAGVALWRQIAEQIEDDLRAGNKGEDRLPTEATLAMRFGVNRHTVRRALAELGKSGLVSAARGRGTFVDPRKLSYAIGARTRFGEAATRAGREASGELLQAREEPADRLVAQHLALPIGSPVLCVATRRYADDVPLATSRSWFPLPRFAGMAPAFSATGSITRAFAACGVDDYRRSETWLGARTALAREAKLLAIEKGAIVLTMESVNVDGAGTPIQCALAVFVASRVEFHVKS